MFGALLVHACRNWFHLTVLNKNALSFVHVRMLVC